MLDFGVEPPTVNTCYVKILWGTLPQLWQSGKGWDFWIPMCGLFVNDWRHLLVYFMEKPMNKWMIWGENPLFLGWHLLRIPMKTNQLVEAAVLFKMIFPIPSPALLSWCSELPPGGIWKLVPWRVLLMGPWNPGSTHQLPASSKWPFDTPNGGHLKLPNRSLGRTCW